MKRPRGTKQSAAAPAPASDAAAVRQPAGGGWLWLLAAVAALVAVFEVYGPALPGPFVLDDLYLPFGQPDAARYAPAVWLARRPLLGLTYLANYRMAGVNPYPYHVTNVLLHLVTALLAFLAVRLALRQTAPAAPNRDLLAALAAGVFLLHPIQTEAVAYIASRSDVLSTLFAYAALAVFLRHREAGVPWPAAALILALFACAVASKEPAAALPAAFLIIDLLWTGGGTGAWDAVKRNWRLHAPMAAGAALGGAWIASTLWNVDTIGARATGFTPLEYFFTQCRVFWRYVRLIVFPAGLNADTDFAVSRSLLDHGAVFGLSAIAALLVAAFLLRKRLPLASAGVLLFLLLLAPTSSFVPIQDAVAERRVYFAMIGITFVLAEAVSRARLSTNALAGAGVALLAVLAVATNARAALWGNPVALWKDTVEKSPRKVRPRFQLAHLYYSGQHCAEAAAEFATAASLARPDAALLADWGLALDCAGKSAEAIARLREAAAVQNGFHVQSQLGMVLGKQNRFDEALAALDESIRLRHDYGPAHVYRGNVLAAQSRWPEAETAFRRALEIDPADNAALQGIAFVEARRGGGGTR